MRAITTMPARTRSRPALTRDVRIALWVALTWVVSVPAPARGIDPQAESRHSTGLALVGLESIQVRPRDEPQALAISAALQLAMDHPADVGYPWVDSTGLVLQLSAASDHGRELLEALPEWELATTVRDVPRSYGELEQLKYDVSRLRGSGIDGEETIYQVEPDWKHSRVILTVDQAHDGLLAEIAKRFGTEAVAVRVNPDEPKAMANPSRNNDLNPFNGGARIVAPLGCTAAFSWKNGDLWQGMLTAGHCAPEVGLTVKTRPDQTIGDVAFENWVVGEGTVPFPGQQDQRGDLALVRARADRHANAWIWRGDPFTTEGDPVRLVWARFSLGGDQYCMGGAVSGDICGFGVVDTNNNVYYWDEEAWADNMVQGHRLGQCPVDGDSGGPVFTLYGDGVAAKGVHSGAGVVGPSCDEFFTDIQLAVQALPGTVKTTP